MWQKRQTAALIDEIDRQLNALSDNIGLKEVVKEALEANGQHSGLSRNEYRPWFLLPLVVCQAISGDFRRAIPLAASLEFLKAAAEVFDDVEDADSAASLFSRYGMPVAVNAATALVILAEKTIASLRDAGVENGTVVQVLDTINSFYIKACAGQHLDLSCSGSKRISERGYLRLISLKTASAVACACTTGASVATENQKIISQTGVFGYNLGIACQIANDIQGVVSGIDIGKGKITLPVIYALTQTQGKSQDRIKAYYKRRGDNTSSEPGEIKDLLYHCGAVQYAIVKMEYYKQLAMDALRQLSTKGIDIELFNIFLSDGPRADQ